MMPAPSKIIPDDESPVDGMRVLRTLAQRWQAAQTLDYRSVVVMRHAGEFSVQIRVSAQFRRPRFARFVFDADRPDAARLRVCDGRILCDRTRGEALRQAQTTREALEAKAQVTQNLPHPLDEASYCADQFFSPTPFWPAPSWGDGSGRVQVSATQKTNASTGKPSQYRITLELGSSRDTLVLDGQYAPVQIVRVGEHGGKVQELLNEKFTAVHLGAYLPAELFRWNARRDEAPGATFLPPDKSSKAGDRL